MKPSDLGDTFPKGPVLGGMTAEDISELLDIPPSRSETEATNGSGIENSFPDGWLEPMSEVAFQGLAGDFVRLVLPETEADKHALMLAFLVIFGCMVGRRPFYQVEATRHGVNLFAVIVGESSRSRKGTAVDRAISILKRVDPVFVETRLRSGLSSGEGLIEAVRDARGEDHQVKEGSGQRRFERQGFDAGVADKRLLAVESEFATVLQMSSREGNVLSAVLRQAWDGKRLSSLARTNKDTCQEPHISVLGNITLAELRKLLTANEKTNGFGNRILWCLARRSKKLPHGGRPLVAAEVDALVLRLQSALRFAGSIDRVEWDPDAYKRWAATYSVLTEDAAGIYGSMTARGEAQTVRLATLYALLDSSSTICRPHLGAAVEVWGYCEQSVRFIVGDLIGDETADRILRMLATTTNGMTQTEINRRFGSHKTAAELARALGSLKKQGKVTQEKIKTGGGPVIRWSLPA